MIVDYKKCQDLPIVVVDDFYNIDELKLIWQELDFLSVPGKMQEPEFTGSGSYVNDDGETVYKKKNLGICLDHVYSDRGVSNILSINRKIFMKDFREQMSTLHSFFRFMNKTNKDISKIHYFTDQDHYLDHDDDSVITVVTYFNKNPKQFTGGDLIFEEDITIETKNNRLVMFPSILRHQVSTITLPTDSDNNGRYALSQFLYVESK
jgi:hypothetical protein